MSPPVILNFLCLLNRCGNLQPNDCNNLLNWCHKAFTVPIDKKMSTTAILMATFLRNPDGKLCEMDKPSLKMNWMRWLDFTAKHEVTADVFRAFRANTLKSHLEKFHPLKSLPYCVMIHSKARKSCLDGHDHKYEKFIKGKKEKRLDNLKEGVLLKLYTKLPVIDGEKPTADYV